MDSMSLCWSVKIGILKFGTCRVTTTALLHPYPNPVSNCSCRLPNLVPKQKQTQTQTQTQTQSQKEAVIKTNTTKKSTNTNTNRSKKDISAELKEKWLDSLSSPLLYPNANVNANGHPSSSSLSLSPWVVGVDPDVSGAIAILKPLTTTTTTCCYTAQVFDSPHVTVLIGKRSRRRLDANSIVQLLRSFDAPVGTTAYVEQSTPFPQDGKQGWYSGGFGYGLWIGVLVASGFSVVPVPSLAWKNKFCLSGSRSSKDDSRDLASKLFPDMCPLLKRKKDHGRAEALLIAAYGKGLNLSTNLEDIPEDLALNDQMD